MKTEKLDIKRRYRIEIGEPREVMVWLVGCGGTGSFLALHLARMAWELGEWLQLVFVDPDLVTEKNIGRQNFCPAEVGSLKAQALAQRYSRAFGLEISFATWPFTAEMLHEHFKQKQGYFSRDFRGQCVILVGCVDGPDGRREIAQVIEDSEGAVWWLDGGNARKSGQVLLGNRMDVNRPEISPLGFCKSLPAPSVVAPELVQSVPTVQHEGHEGESCAELMAWGEQGLMVNQAVAGWMATYLYRLLVGRDLDIWQTYLDLGGGTVRSVGIEGE